MAISLPETLEITADDEHEPCRFCGDPTAADPDDLDRWAAHLTEWHGYRVVEDHPRTEREARWIRLELAGWSSRAKFRPNQRVTVNDKAPGDYAGRRGTVIGWRARTSEYIVAFDEQPLRGALDSDWLDPFVKP